MYCCKHLNFLNRKIFVRFHKMNQYNVYIMYAIKTLKEFPKWNIPHFYLFMFTGKKDFVLQEISF